MHDYSSFDNKKLKRLDWLNNHFYLIIIIGVLIVIFFALIKLYKYVLLEVIFGLLISWYLLGNSAPFTGNDFAEKNKLEKFFLKHDDDWGFMYDQYQSLINSSLAKKESFVWSLEINQTEIAIMLTSDGGCVAWIQLDRKFPHIVVDSLKADHPLKKTSKDKNWPPQEIKLEGDFPDYFHVYQETNKQQITLEILSPDRMAYLVDHLKNINLEIQDNYLRLFYANAQDSSVNFQYFINILNSFQQNLKVSAINTIN